MGIPAPEDHVDQHDTRKRAHQVQGRQQAHQGVDHDLQGQECPDHQQGEEQLGTACAPAGQDVTVQSPERNRNQRAGHHDQHRVPESGAHALTGHARAGTAPGRAPRRQRGLRGPRQQSALPDLVHALERGEPHHVQRQKEAQRRRNEEREQSQTPRIGIPAWPVPPAGGARDCRGRYAHARSRAARARA